MKERRIFIAPNVNESMWRGWLGSTPREIKAKTVNPDELRNIRLISSIKNRAVIGTLRERYGIEISDRAEMFSVEAGDILYTVSLATLGNLLDYANEPRLPEGMSLIFARYEFPEEQNPEGEHIEEEKYYNEATGEEIF